VRERNSKVVTFPPRGGKNKAKLTATPKEHLGKRGVGPRNHDRKTGDSECCQIMSLYQNRAQKIKQGVTVVGGVTCFHKESEIWGETAARKKSPKELKTGNVKTARGVKGLKNETPQLSQAGPPPKNHQTGGDKSNLLNKKLRGERG